MIFRLQIVFLIVLVNGCSTSKSPNVNEGVESESNSEKAADDLATDNEPTRKPSKLNDHNSGVRSKQTFVNTGVKCDVLLEVINSNVHPNKEFHHQFESDGTQENVSFYKDQYSSIGLVLMGPPNDLILIEMTMPLSEFLGESPDGKLTGKGGAAFGRVVQRLGLAVDPSWTKELYAWMNKNIKVALWTDMVRHSNTNTFLSPLTKPNCLTDPI